MTDETKQKGPLPGNLKILIIVIIAAVFVMAVVIAMVFVSPSGPNVHGTKPVSLNISGSTTIQPVSEFLANAYMQNHPDIRVNVEGGGSGAGITKAGTGQIDIGSSSRNLNPDEIAKYPDLQTFKIGGSAVVVIVNRNNPVNEADKSELQVLYNDKSEDISNLPSLGNIRLTVQRSDNSGTEETFAQWLDPKLTNLNAAMNATDYSGMGQVKPLSVEGNEGVVQAVAKNPDAIGFADFGFAERDTGVKILKLQETSSDPALPQEIANARERIREELNRGDQNNTYYISRLTRPLLYITKGSPSTLENDFITFARSTVAAKYFDDIGYFSITEFSTSAK
ncbi:MAG: substrate-binding domain-containing protein [Methanomicrobiales archaeon]